MINMRANGEVLKSARAYTLLWWMLLLPQRPLVHEVVSDLGPSDRAESFLRTLGRSIEPKFGAPQP